MARIRTIKPDFWTDDKIVGLSPMARLFFIGMWNFADDHGGIERSSRQLKMKIFPGDDVDVEPLVQELLRGGMVVEYAVDDAPYLNIVNFLRHQRINRPSTPRIPAFKESTHRTSLDGSMRTHGGLTEDSVTEGKGSGSGSGMEGKGKEVDGKGMDGRGTGREGEHALPLPPLEGGGAAAPQDRGNGKGDLLDFTESLTLLKRDALLHAITLFNSKEWDIDAVNAHLKGAGFVKNELMRAQEIIPKADAMEKAG